MNNKDTRRTDKQIQLGLDRDNTRLIKRCRRHECENAIDILKPPLSNSGTSRFHNMTYCSPECRSSRFDAVRLHNKVIKLNKKAQKILLKEQRLAAHKELMAQRLLVRTQRNLVYTPFTECKAERQNSTRVVRQKKQKTLLEKPINALKTSVDGTSINQYTDKDRLVIDTLVPYWCDQFSKTYVKKNDKVHDLSLYEDIA